MKDIEILEDMTLFDISVNEGALTQLVLGVVMFGLGIIYLCLEVWNKLAFWRRL